MTDTTALAKLTPESVSAEELMSLAYATDATTVSALINNKHLADKAHMLARHRQQVRALELTDEAMDKVGRLLMEEDDLAKATNAMDKLARLQRPLPETGSAGAGIAFRIILPGGQEVECKAALAASETQADSDDAAGQSPVSIEVKIPTSTYSPSPLVLDGEFEKVETHRDWFDL